MVEPVAKGVRWLGLWHSWSMFAPRPILVNRRITVEYVLANGLTLDHQLMQIHQQPKWLAFLNNHERKFQTNLAGNDHKSHRAALCDYAIRQLDPAHGKIVRVNLWLDKQFIAGPESLYADSKVATERPWVRSRLWTMSAV